MGPRDVRSGLPLSEASPRADTENRVKRAPSDQTGNKWHESEYLEHRCKQFVADDKPSEIDRDQTYDDANSAIFGRLVEVLYR